MTQAADQPKKEKKSLSPSFLFAPLLFSLNNGLL
jgi:hypothetical protein